MKIILSFLIFLFTCIGWNCNKTVDARISQTELEIYKKLLADKPKNVVVVSSETRFIVFGIDQNNFKEILKGVRNDTFESLAKANTKQTEIDDKVRLSFDYPLVTEKT